MSFFLAESTLALFQFVIVSFSHTNISLSLPMIGTHSSPLLLCYWKKIHYPSFSPRDSQKQPTRHYS